MENGNYQNTAPNQFSADPQSHDPKPENNAIRTEDYWSGLHPQIDNVHLECASSNSQAEIAIVEQENEALININFHQDHNL